jgi:uncharacterized protein (TIGR00266 family)
MQTEIHYQPAYALCRIILRQGEQVRAESGAMVSMVGIEVETAATGGLLKSLGRSLLGGESFFQNTFTAQVDGAELTVAPELPGDIVVMSLNDQDLFVQSGSFLASELGITVDPSWGGARSFFGGEGLFMLRCAGSGVLVVSSYGAIHHVAIPAGRSYTVDTGHIVAFSGGAQYQIRKIGSWKSTIFGGEGLVVDLAGPADLYLQTRSPAAFLGWLIPKLPNRSGDG